VVDGELDVCFGYCCFLFDVVGGDVLIVGVVFVGDVVVVFGEFGVEFEFQVVEGFVVFVHEFDY